MKKSLAILSVASLAGAQVHSAPTSHEVPLSGISMTTAKRLHGQTQVPPTVQEVSLSGVPMPRATRLDASPAPRQTLSTAPTLSGIPMVRATRSQ